MPLFRDTPALLVPFREGRPAALEQTYRHYVRGVDDYFHALARFARAPELAQPSAVADLIQETFIRAFSPSARRAYDGLRPYSPYLNTIARHCFVDALRKRKKEILVNPEELPLEPMNALDRDDTYDPKVLAVLETYLSQLPAPLKGVYEQRFVLGVSQELACETLRVSRRTLRTSEDHLRRGLRKALLLAGVLHPNAGFAVAPPQEGWL
jgi:RNA polymerase sigma-70 factor (ECF subfamily)